VDLEVLAGETTQVENDCFAIGAEFEGTIPMATNRSP
jgi:hypothetical protein